LFPASTCPNWKGARMPRRKAEPTGPSDTTRLAVWVRCGGVCERCGRERAGDPHHRDGRRMGGSRAVPWINRLSNLLGLCRKCHDWVETEGRAGLSAYRDGLLVRRSTAEQLGGVSLVPVYDLHARAWILTDDGRKHLYTMADYDPRVAPLTHTADDGSRR
jgi:5-methylcytosine-specific restriction enzyme A